MSYSVFDRQANIKKMSAQEFDLVVIGGGISGAGVARDAASRGMKVALVEAGDFASGTSSRSSKLIHGGIRYLENLEFGLVFEALNERRTLFEIAPHLVHPLRFVLPLYKGGHVGMFKLGLGMWLYDALALFETPEMHEGMDKAKTLDRVPTLNGKDLVGSYAYSDAYMDDDRLVIETLRSAAGFGAVTANYVCATGAEFSENKMSHLLCRDEFTKELFKIKGRHFVSTVGPWTDIVASQLLGQWKNIMRPSKGVHLTFRRDRFQLQDAVVMISDDEKRIVFAIPRHEMLIIGTTDTDFKGDPKDVRTTREDVDYLLGIVDKYFPGAKITESDILGSYSGVRPLVDDGSSTESKTSREHLIFSDPRGITFLTGGKYTTYRKMAEETVLAVLENFALEDRVRFARGRTHVALNPLATIDLIARTQNQVEQIAQAFGVDVDTVNFLTERHGLEAEQMLARFGGRAGDAIAARWRIEAYHSIQETMCHNLIDYYLRRVPLFLSREDHGFKILDEIALIFQQELGWSEEKKSAAVNALRNHVTHEMGWQIS